MVENTKARLTKAASDLLDAGGQRAVTLRSVAELVGVSHNAPYRHFKDRSALLAAVAEQDFDALRRAFQAEADEGKNPHLSLRAATRVMIAYAREHPARYRLLFSDPNPMSVDESLGVAAFGSFQTFNALVQQCQASGKLRSTETAKLTGLIYATLHGAIDLELGGRAREAKGLGSIEATVDLLLDVLAQHSPADPGQAATELVNEP